MAITTTSAVPAGLRQMPLVGWRGNVVQFFRDPLTYMRASHAAHGDVCALAHDTPFWMLTFNPEYTRQILTDTTLFYSEAFINTKSESALRRMTSGLLSMNGDPHRQHRRLMMPHFHRKRVETYRDEMIVIVQEILDGWQTGQQMDIAREMQQITMRVVSKALFGVDATASALQTGAMMREWLALQSSSLAQLMPEDRFGTPYRRLLRLSDQIESRIRLMIAEKRLIDEEAHDILALLIATRDEGGAFLTDAELIGHVGVLFIAGYETTAAALGWTLFLLAQHPAIAADLYEELDSVLHGDAPTFEQLGRLPLLDRVIKESMRILPPVTYSYRYGTAPFELGPYQLPERSVVMFSPYITHHSPEIYAEPERFMPDRWLTIDPSPYEYLPFGAGPRMCIGTTFAMMEIRIALAMILQRFRLALVPNAQIERRVKVSLTPKYGLPMVAVPQDQQFARSRAAVRGNIHEMVNLRR